MTAFYIAPYKPTDWESATSDLVIDPTSYKEKMLERWPESEFFSTSPELPLQWMISSFSEGDEMPPHGIGSLHADMQIVSFDTPYSEFFLWHRSVIQSQHDLYLFNDSSLESLKLEPDTTFDEIEEFINTGS